LKLLGYWPTLSLHSTFQRDPSKQTSLVMDTFLMSLFTIVGRKVCNSLKVIFQCFERDLSTSISQPLQQLKSRQMAAVGASAICRDAFGDLLAGLGKGENGMGKCLTLHLEAELGSFQG
jgi:hypothetical protein